MFSTIFTWVMQVIPVLPSLITDIEKLWGGTAQSGSQKWLSVEQAMSGSISAVAEVAAKLAPAGTSVDAISTAVDIFVKAVNDAFVALANTLQLFPHAGQPAANAATPAPAAKK
ncbi:MAG: hypothetical protein ACRD4Q_00160 [Candidatus Acidiferrales bacterium]